MKILITGHTWASMGSLSYEHYWINAMNEVLGGSAKNEGFDFNKDSRKTQGIKIKLLIPCTARDVFLNVAHVGTGINLLLKLKQRWTLLEREK